MKHLAAVLICGIFCASGTLAVAADQPVQGDGQVHVFLLGSNVRTPMMVGEVNTKMIDQYRPGLFQFVPPANIPTHMEYELKGGHAVVTTSPLPAFEMDIAHAYMIDPAHFEPVILRLHPDGPEFRVIGTQTSNSNVRTSTTALEPIADDREAVSVSTIAPGRLHVAPAQPLSPGEYGVAMRDPDVKTVTYSSSGAAQDTPGMSKQQAYQTIVWDFAVQP